MSLQKLMRALIIIAVFGLISAVMSRLLSNPVKKFTKADDFFGAVVKVDVCYVPEKEDALDAAIEEVWLRFADIHTRLSVYDPDSDINRINAAAPEPAAVGPDTYALIRDSLQYRSVSRGVFDVTLGPVIALWKAAGREGVLPSTAQIAEALSSVDAGAVALLEDGRIALKRKGIRINIDSIGDGYAADEAARILRRHGFRDFLIDASGELFAGGHNCQGRKWRVGIRDPQDPSRLIQIVELSDLAISTSGTYERFFEIDARRYSHIIDPRTGYPAEGLLSASVIAPTAQEADFLSTAFCILEPNESMSIIDSLGGDHAALLVLDAEGPSAPRQESSAFPAYKSAP